MNQRIRELVARDFIPDCNGDIMTTPESIADFAQLIIQEANDVVYSLLEENTGAEVVVRVKEHFGVEW